MVVTMYEADERFLDLLRDDIQRRLGPAVDVQGLHLERKRGVVSIVATCETPVGAWSVSGDGADLLAAAEVMLKESAAARVAISFRQLVEHD